MIDATMYNIYYNNKTILFKQKIIFTYKSRKILK